MASLVLTDSSQLTSDSQHLDGSNNRKVAWPSRKRMLKPRNKLNSISPRASWDLPPHSSPDQDIEPEPRRKLQGHSHRPPPKYGLLFSLPHDPTTPISHLFRLHSNHLTFIIN
uniref:Uncharacterized protein n=1 Tax=Timema poppense TaxID=170557 RepID=A0A7R9HDK2_TIMPO|nr:unnamed protein product [Timema poppensis]